MNSSAPFTVAALTWLSYTSFFLLYEVSVKQQVLTMNSTSNISAHDKFYASSINIAKIHVTNKKNTLYSLTYTIKVASDGFSLHKGAWVIPSHITVTIIHALFANNSMTHSLC